MNRTWSVRTVPYLVLTVVPSTIGKRSRWTPWRETSGPRPPPPPSSPPTATLSISSRKTIPDSSASATASAWIFSGSKRASDSWARRIGRASATVMVRALGGLGMNFSNIPWRSISICSMFGRPQDRDRGTAPTDEGDLDLAVLQLAGVRAGPSSSRAIELVDRRPRRGRPRARFGRGRGRREEEVEQPAFDPGPGRGGDLLLLPGLDQRDRRFDQVADQALDVPAVSSRPR